MKIIIVFAALACLSFLYSLNLYLRGSLKTVIESVVILLIIVTVAISFFISQWWIGLISIFSIFIYVAIFISLTKPLAHKIVGYRTGIDEDTKTTSNSIYKKIVKPGGFNKVMKQMEKHRERNKNKLVKISNQSNILSVLNEYEISFDEYHKLFESLKDCGLNDIAWEIVSSPKDLEDLICLKIAGADNVEISAHYRN